MSRAVPVGKRYYWRVRACFEAECSAWTRMRYLEVGRVEKDFNGDGYADVIVGASGEAGGAGRAHLLFGRAGLETTSQGREPLRLAVTLGSPSDQQNGGFGAAVANAGDLNGDGFADAIVGAAIASGTGGQTLAGRAYVFFGRAGLDNHAATPVAAHLTLAPPFDQQGARFGAAVAGAGDLDGDGLADAIVGAVGADDANGNTSGGGAYIFFGKANLGAYTLTPLNAMPIG